MLYYFATHTHTHTHMHITFDRYSLGHAKSNFGEQTSIICFENVRVLGVHESIFAPFLDQNCVVFISQAVITIAGTIPFNLCVREGMECYK